MFKRRSTYVMQISGVIHYPPLEEMRAAMPKLAEAPDEDLHAVLAESLVRQVMDVANEELRRHRQKLGRRFETAGHGWETGSEVNVNPLGEHWVDFTVVFDGNTEGAAAAAQAWIERVETFKGLERITHAALRGTDGTYLHRFGEEIEERAANLDDETRAQIEQLMDPASEDLPSAAYSDEVFEGTRLAAAYNVDLFELANSILVHMAQARPEGATGEVRYFPAEAVRAMCSMEFVVAAELSDPQLDEAFIRSAESPSEEARANVADSVRRVIEERGLAPVVDALIELIRDNSAPPASELL
jgi:hypothetical protein